MEVFQDKLAGGGATVLNLPIIVELAESLLSALFYVQKFIKKIEVQEKVVFL